MSWHPKANREMLQARADLLACIRRFFAVRNVLEVETPLLAKHGVTDTNINSIAAQVGTERLWLNTSPEHHMKRLLAANIGDIYQICKAFRDAESGQRHQPEFTMLEWYRLNYSTEQLQVECCELLCALDRHLNENNHVICASSPAVYTYAGLFKSILDLDIFAIDTEILRNAVIALLGNQLDQSLTDKLAGNRQQMLDLLFSHKIAPELHNGQLHIVTDYPQEQAALARLKPGTTPVADRFEIFFKGVELANGYHELADADEQQRRFEHDLELRQAAAQPIHSIDTTLLAALEHGLPNCAGVAMGLDRILMLLQSETDMRETLSFLPGS